MLRRRCCVRWIVGLVVLWAVVGAVDPARLRADDDARATWFREQVAPIFETRCLGCHQGVTARGHLSLESLQQVLDGGDSGPAIDPGSAEDSLLIYMISGDEPEMPKKGQPLSEDEVAAIARWIDEGAVWPDGVALKDRSREGPWWSLEPLKQPEVPQVASHWPRTPIDAFILAKLEKLGLEPAPEADRRTLIRRLYFDLIGLPPTPEEVDQFVADDDPMAYERLVDRLLASPHYGERWARHWLDVVHYADTHGYDKDKRRDHAWPYRDYVIRALNEDRPYQRFIMEQVAGDVLFPDSPDGVIATGFIAAGPWDFVGHVELREGTMEKKKTRLIDRDDMVSTTIGTFASLTVHCARCHDHPFDPIPQDDYYALQAVFAGVDRGDRPYNDPQRTAARRALAARLEKARQQRDALLAEKERLTSPELRQIDAELAQLQQRISQLPDAWTSEGKPVQSATNGYHSAIMEHPQSTKWVQVDLGTDMPIELVRLVPARPTDFPDTPGFGFPLRFQVAVATEAAPNDWQVIDDHTEANVPNPGDHAWTIFPSNIRGRYVRVTATRLWERTNDFVFALAELQVVSQGRNAAFGAKLTAKDSIDAGRWHTKYLVDGFSSRHQLPDPATEEQMQLARQRVALRESLAAKSRERAELIKKIMPDELSQRLAAVEQQLAALRQEQKRLSADPLVYAVRSHAPREVSVLRRGDVRQPLRPAQVGTLGCLKMLPSRFTSIDPADEGARRAALARWLADPNNALVWRSIVNRLWHYHFGRGIVDTPNDFGRNGSLPTHPQLLDWLATELLRQNGSLKAMHRLIVTSAVYRQSSRHDPRAERLDAGNRYLWRMNRRRLDAESFRDAVLAASGVLNRKIGGPAFELFEFEDDHSPRYNYVPMDRPEVWRRTIYRFTVRSVPNPFFEALDCPNPSLTAPVRQTTITPLQALAMLNDAFVVQQARHLARRVADEHPDDVPAQVEAAFRLVLLRRPSADERSMLADYARRHSLPAACRLLLNTNEFCFVD